MIYIYYAFIIFVATFLGAVAGLGGGVIIKPALDFIGAHDLETIGIISSIAVFSMALYSTTKHIRNKTSFDFSLILLVSLGATIGGTIGNALFDLLFVYFNEATCNLVQIILLILLLVLVLINMNTKHPTFQLKNKGFIFIVGICLGTLSSFLSIGGGPINVAVFALFFSIDMKTSAVYSIATILFSQVSKLIMIFINQGFVGFDFTLLLFVIPCAILGGIIGTKVHRFASEKMIRYIFNGTVLGIILLNIYNLFTLI